MRRRRPEGNESRSHFALAPGQTKARVLPPRAVPLARSLFSWPALFWGSGLIADLTWLAFARPRPPTSFDKEEPLDAAHGCLWGLIFSIVLWILLFWLI